jgi:hypothetical protein
VDALTEAGFTKAFSVVDGFEGDKIEAGPNQGRRVVNGWKNSHLPWDYPEVKDKIYLPGER